MDEGINDALLVCRLHEALQEVHQIMVQPPVPVNPYPSLTKTFLKYGCNLDLWDSRLVSNLMYCMQQDMHGECTAVSN